MAAVSVKRSIRLLHISHNAPYLPSKVLHNLCFSFLLGITAVPREIENNAYAKFWGRQITCTWQIKFDMNIRRDNQKFAARFKSNHFSSSLCEISVCLIHQNSTNFLCFIRKFDAENLHLKMEELENLGNSVNTKKVRETCVFIDTGILL